MQKIAQLSQFSWHKKLTLTSLLTAMLAITACQSGQSDSHVQTTQISQQQIDSNGLPMTQTPSNNQQEVENITANDLERYHWTLINATNANKQPFAEFDVLNDNQQATLTFSNGRLSPSIGCNTMSKVYEIKDNVLQTKGDMISTLMGCGEGDPAEHMLAYLVSSTSQLSLKQDVAKGTAILTQVTNNGDTLIWQGTLTPQAKYNQKGDTVFWAVKGETQPCNDGMGGTTTCLQVQPVSYNEQGQKTAQGQWQLYNGTIEGYEHNEGNNQVLRLSRYVVTAPHVKGKQFAYVLDQVVESELNQ